MFIACQMPTHPYISGQLLFNNSIVVLNDFFRGSSIHHEIRHSSHFQDGIYLRLSTDTGAGLTFEKTGADEFLIEGEANTQNDLEKLAALVSSTLTKQRLKHRLELYSTDDNEFSYFHYNWAK
ncbi:MAG: hypothetical protein JST26_04620 [Bacteroidetes bacterium]|nr:hypothetical protein [Bacteroidota bacterium]